LKNILTLVTALAAASLSGCLATNNSTKTVSGKEINATTFAQVVPGNTKDSVLALLGEPSSKVKRDDGTETWNLRYSEDQKSESGVLFVFYGGNETKTVTVRHVDIKDNVVTKTWSD